jgi:phosphoribosylformylglycinamidine synthase subunit PurS
VSFEVSVNVLPKPGISDPQGQTIERALPNLGFEGVRDVRVGKRIQFTLDALDQDEATTRAAQMCEQLLANTVIETYEVNVR